MSHGGQGRAGQPHRHAAKHMVSQLPGCPSTHTACGEGRRARDAERYVGSSRPHGLAEMGFLEHD